MGSTFHSLHYHLVFSTKERRPWIAPAWRDKLHEYLGGTTRGLSGVAEIVGGVADHVHLLVSLKPSLALAEFVRELKKSSSVWAAENHEPRFSWQEGYAIFSVSSSLTDTVRDYIARQEAHHRRRDFRAELELLLTKHGIEFQLEYLD